jgi:predicted membrane-bound spermidine synthase
MKKNDLLLEIIVFLSGAIVMILEIVGSRILAPQFGTSIFVWTSLIGIILGCLSIGYFWGGWLADRRPDYGVFALILLLAALSTALASLVQSPLLEAIQRNVKDIRIGTLLGTIALFGIPGVLLGMVSPYAVRLQMESVGTSGKTVGRIYAISTVGSIVGTFSAGFFLIALIGSQNILYSLSFCLLILSFLAYCMCTDKKCFLKGIFLCSTTALIIFFSNLYLKPPARYSIDFDTDYHRIWIYDAHESSTDRPKRVITTSARLFQGEMYLDKDDDLVPGYANYYRLAKHFVPGFETTLMVGGGGYSYPKDYLRNFKNAAIDVVEIDPGMTRMARQYFNLRDNPRMQIFHEDGRVFLQKRKRYYDVIILDAIKSFYSIPFHLVTKEAVQLMYDRLNADGALFVNIIGTLGGDNGRTFRAFYATCKAVFPQIYIFAINSKNPAALQNLILVCLNSERSVQLESINEEFSGFFQNNLIKEDIEIDIPILTDDFAPVDQYNLNML